MRRLQRAVNNKDPSLNSYKLEFETSKKNLERLIKDTKKERDAMRAPAQSQSVNVGGSGRRLNFDSAHRSDRKKVVTPSDGGRGSQRTDKTPDLEFNKLLTEVQSVQEENTELKG